MSLKPEACIACERSFYDSERYPNTVFHWGAFNLCGDCDLEIENHTVIEFIKLKERDGTS